MLNQYDIFWDEDHNIYQIRTKTDIYAIEFDNPKKKYLFDDMVKLSREEEGIGLNKLIQQLEKNHDRFLILEVLDELKEYGLLTTDYFVDLAILTKEPNPNSDDPKQRKVLIIGEEHISTKIQSTFSEEGFTNVDIQSIDGYLNASDYNFLANYDFFVVDGHNWNPVLLRSVNKALVKMKKPWLYLKGLEAAEIKIGPIFLGGELGCYDCLRKRIESNDELAPYNRNYLKYLENGNKTAQPDKIPLNSTAMNILASLTVSEVSKYFEQWALPETIGSYISFNVVSYKSETHKLLKIPYCETCRPKMNYNLAPWLEAVTLN